MITGKLQASSGALACRAGRAVDQALYCRVPQTQLANVEARLAASTAAHAAAEDARAATLQELASSRQDGAAELQALQVGSSATMRLAFSPAALSSPAMQHMLQ